MAGCHFIETSSCQWQVCSTFYCVTWFQDMYMEEMMEQLNSVGRKLRLPRVADR